VIAPLPLSVVIEGPCLIFRPNFKLMLYSYTTVVFNVGENPLGADLVIYEI